jgi:hypothetical protein
MHCGIPGDGLDIRLAPPAHDWAGATDEPPALPAMANELAPTAETASVDAAARPREAPTTPVHYRVSFAKRGDARWLSHRNVMDLLERSLRAAAAPVAYTSGFNPHIRLSMGPALALGVEAENELFDVGCHAPLADEVLERANRVLPEGLSLISFSPLGPGERSLGKAVAACRYRIDARPGLAPWLGPGGPACVDQLSNTAGVLEVIREGADLLVVANARQTDGPTPSVRSILAALGLPDELAPLVPVRREACLLGETRNESK